jgi:hypothetical protein
VACPFLVDNIHSYHKDTPLFSVTPSTTFGYTSKDEPTEYRTVTVNGAQILLSPLGHEKAPQGRTIEDKVRKLINDAIVYQTEEHQKKMNFLRAMLDQQGTAEQSAPADAEKPRG